MRQCRIDNESGFRANFERAIATGIRRDVRVYHRDERIVGRGVRGRQGTIYISSNLGIRAVEINQRVIALLAQIDLDSNRRVANAVIINEIHTGIQPVRNFLQARADALLRII